jgi:NADPH2:quinone reductase
MIRAVIVNPHVKESFTIQEVEAPKAQPWEAIV